MRPGVTVWFTRKNYAAHRALDPEGLPPTFDEWRALVGHRVGQKRPYLRVVFNPGHFAAWCRAEGRDIDASARTAFAEIAAIQSRRRG
jgi:hypothetical protein